MPETRIVCDDIHNVIFVRNDGHISEMQFFKTKKEKTWNTKRNANKSMFINNIYCWMHWVYDLETLWRKKFWAECVFCRKYSDVTISRYPILIETVIYDQKCVHSFVDTIFLANTTSRWGSSCFSCVFQRCFSQSFSTISCWTIRKIVFDLNRIVFIYWILFLSSWALFLRHPFQCGPLSLVLNCFIYFFYFFFDVKNHSELQA